MKILAIDTSCSVATAAVSEDDKLLGEYTVNHKMTHSQTIMPMIDTLLESLEMDIADIDLFAVAVGPGSFTGLRIGVSAVKGLAQALNKPAMGFNSLEALAENIPFSGRIIVPLMDARNNFVYNASYVYMDKLEEIRKPSADSIYDVLDTCDDYDSIVFIGDGALIHRELIKDKLRDKADIACCNSNMQRASSLCALAYENYSADKQYSLENLSPMYLRKSQAEREYEERNKQK